AATTSPMTMSARPILLAASCPLPLDKLHAAEEVAELEGRRLRRVGPMRRVAADRLAEVAAQRPRRRLGGVGRPHRVAPLLDGVRRLEREQHTGRSEEHTSELQSP